MPISPLPESTVRRLGSSLVITSPVSLLKELLDNALDAEATSIEVLVSPNTVDRIEVRDNGHGINPSDFDSLGRPRHTSKLKSFDELGSLGGSTLGFRGAALASANALADVSLTTRVSSEHVATVVSLRREGGITVQRHTSAPVGTTVVVTGLFSRLPVRSQVAVKEAPKNLTKMRELLQSYALARHRTRLRFTVLKTPSLSWSYAPAANSDVKEAAVQLFGTEFASNCLFEVFASEIHRADPSASRSGSDSCREQATGLVFEALLPKPDADPRQIGKGGFFSIDSRPVSPARGTAKKLFLIFKKRLADRFSRLCCTDVPRDPFIRLNIRCPPGSYDVNVEASKEDVLFKEEQHVLDQFERFLASIYRTSDDHEGPQPSLMTVATTVAGALGGVPPQVPDDPSLLQATAPSWKVDMSSGLDGRSDDGNGTDDTPPLLEERRSNREMSATSGDGIGEGNDGSHSKEGLNPWSIAKLTGRRRRGEPTVDGLAQEHHLEARTSPPKQTATRGSGATLLSNTQQLRSSEELNPPPYNQNRVNSPSSLDHNVFGRASRGAAASSTRPSERQEWPRYSRELQSPPSSSPRRYDCDVTVPRERSRPAYLAGPGQGTQSKMSSNRNNRRQWRPNSIDSELNQPSQTRSGSNGRSAATRRLNTEKTNYTLANYIDIDDRHARTLMQAMMSRRSTPHDASDSIDAETRVRRDKEIHQEATQQNLPIEAPRVHLIRRNRSVTHNPLKKPKRLRTDQLPLETIPRGSETHTLVLAVTLNCCRVARLLNGASRFDSYLVDGELSAAFRDGTISVDTVLVVKSFLARIGYGSTEHI
ncbi:hypothetical protein VTK56DRAFT_8698 [Thermocarpiscus australiensis]